MRSSRSARLTVLTVAIVALLALPATAAPANLPEGAIPLPGGGYAQELSAPTPHWYTPQLHERVLAAGAEGVPIPADADIPASGLAFTGIRPGAWMFFPSWCTMNFVFGGTSANTATTTKAKGSAKKAGAAGGGSSGWYIGTAGHCAEVGDEVTLIAAPGLLMNIGKTVKSYDNDIGKDFALIEIYPEMVQYVNPSMTHWGGPTGTNTDVAVGDPVVHSGHGAAIGTGGTPRAGVVTYVGNGDNNAETAYGWDGAATPGDSGSAVRHADGRAEGNLTHLVVGTEYAPAFIAGTTAEYMERLAGLPICDAPLVPNPLPAPTCGP